MSFVDLRFVSKRDVLSKILRNDEFLNLSTWKNDVFINYAALSSTRYTLLRIKKRNEDAVLLLVSFPKLTLCLAFEQKFECF